MIYSRYAIYYAPETNSPLLGFANSWLGWNPEKRQFCERPLMTGLSAQEIANITTAPSRYGFHGTLKPPFYLKDTTVFDQLDRAIQHCASTLAPISCGALALKKIGSFLALCPQDNHGKLAKLAASCVETLDHFRAPPQTEELERRRKNGLTPRQEELLQSWGYPYVMEEFRFHLTLTNKLSIDDLTRVENAITNLIGPLCSSSFDINEICLFGDPGQGKPFHLLKRYRLQEGQ